MTTIKMISRLFIFSASITYSCSYQTDNSKKLDTITKSVNTFQKDTSLDGLYAGLEEMCWTDSAGKKDCYIDAARPTRKWYHLGYLKIKGDSVFLDQDPVNIGKKHDTLWSSSDGAFYYYHGILVKLSDTTFTINLKEIFCDYCGEPVEVQKDGTYKRVYRIKTYKCNITKNGFFANNIFYKKDEAKDTLISEHPELFLKSLP